MEGWLGNRIEELVESKSFVCHKNNNLQCAGHMILNQDNNEYHKFATITGVDLGLNGQELIFDSKQECINHHKNYM